MRKRRSAASAISSGASSRQGPHHDAHTLSKVTSPLNVSAVEARHRTAIALEAGKRRKVGRRRGLADQRRRKARGIAGTEAVHEQRRQREKGDQRDEHDQPPLARSGFPLGRVVLDHAHGFSLRDRRAIPCAVELVEHANQVPAVDHDPRDQPRHDGDRGGVGGHDECSVRSEIHRHARASACIISMVRTRRRMISLRMAARCSVRNSSVKATSEMINGTRIDE